MMDFQNAKITWDTGFLLLREIDDRFGVLSPTGTEGRSASGANVSESARPRHNLGKHKLQRRCIMVDAESGHIQEEVARVLRRGIIFSILWLFGIGSLIAVMSGLKARRLILDSNGAVGGMGQVWWRLIVGGLGVAFWLPILVVGVINNLSG